MLTATTVFVYRRKHPEQHRPYRVWGYPILPGVFVVCAAAVLVSSYTSNLKGSLLGTALILLGLPILWFIHRLYPAPIENTP
jgi:APA family basic amino acid/polyamine antiporter